LLAALSASFQKNVLGQEGHMISGSRLKIQVAAVVLLLAINAQSGIQQKPAGTQRSSEASGASAAKRPSFIKAFVVDDRLSTLRREPGLQSEVIHRLRLGHPVYIIATRTDADARYCRVAVTRRTRGWILEPALALSGKAGEDQRVMKLIEATKDGIDRIALCRLLIDRFSQSQLVPRALLVMGEEADRVAQTLTLRSRKRLADAAEENWNASARAYFLNDVGLDRYSKLHVVFDFNEATSEYVYDGRAYGEIVRRFPNNEAAIVARERLDLARQKMARRQ
jgi:hypothetical protein